MLTRNATATAEAMMRMRECADTGAIVVVVYIVGGCVWGRVNGVVVLW